ncbi:putative peptide modification system cyclase [Oleiagrimonas sp. C23AA]|uniref:putative peptide modification system cyclase n=1 Tax=Oleiagrimonas sp. C23AA TaxID=2719047 RepID=UPI00141E8974|nr:putative peptide modification system cyclase [Oleiagrimonas sp. C23AA]NII10897.1 putative peptide modification system cyclase [Oleiagrimonas sp. C23AA]
MEAVSGQEAAPEVREPVPQLRTIVVCDLSDSTGMVQRLGDRRAAELIRAHDRLARTVLQRHGGQEIDKTDGFLLLFERPIRAVAFALDYQHALEQLAIEQGETLRSRVGIHVGDVVLWHNDADAISRGAKPLEVEGLVKPIASRLASLARPGQILLSQVAAGFAQRAEGELKNHKLRWKKHGTYRAKGLSTPLSVVEVGDATVGPMKAPRSHRNARRDRSWLKPKWLAVFGIILAASTAGSIWWGYNHSERSLGFSARDWVVVGDIQNHTGIKNISLPLKSAFLLDLQQSRYVNVMPDAIVRDTLRQMRLRKKTNIEKKIGINISLRLNAKALILPSIDNYGSDFLLIATIINPTTGTPVAKFSEKASDKKSLVPAIDGLVKKMRGSLGETIDQIKSSSVPLQQATTDSLDALRAYTLGYTALQDGDAKLATDVTKQAIKLDPGFAAAYAQLGAIYLSLNRKEAAREAMDNALKRSGRLSYLEQLRIQALKTTAYGSPLEAIAAWKVMADLYPDIASGPNNTGLFLAAYNNDCKLALPYLHHAATLPQSLRPVSIYVLGTCQLATGSLTNAEKNLKKARQAGFKGPFLGLADLYIMEKKYKLAYTYINLRSKDKRFSVSVARRRAMLLEDQGKLQEAVKVLADSLFKLSTGKRGYDVNTTIWSLKLDLVAMRWTAGQKEAARAETKHWLDQLLSMKKVDRDRLVVDYRALTALFSAWSARMGNTSLAKKALDELHAQGKVEGNPVLSQIYTLAQAEIYLSSGDARRAYSMATSVRSNPIWEIYDLRARAALAASGKNAQKLLDFAIRNRALAFGEIFENNLGIGARVASLQIDKHLRRTRAAQVN